MSHPKLLTIAGFGISCALVCALVCVMAPNALGQNGSIEIVKVDGQFGTDTLAARFEQWRFVLRYKNTTGHKVDVYNSFVVFSPDGALFGPTSLDTLAPYSSGHSSFTAYFTSFDNLSTGNGSSDGQPDTLGFSAWGAAADPLLQLPVGFNDTVLAITVKSSGAPGSVIMGKHLCIDSLSRQASGSDGTWRWVSTNDPENSTSFNPSFGLAGSYPGAHCWTFFEYPCCGLPVITNPPGSIVRPFCNDMSLDYNASGGYGDPITFLKVSGPGQIDENTGVWTWANISYSAVGTYELRIAAKSNGSVGPSAVTYVSVTDTNFHMTSGCGGTFHLTGDSVAIQMATSPICGSLQWSAQKTYGDTAIFSMNQSGLLKFTTAAPGHYQFATVADLHGKRDSCWHTFIVHGGPGCCVGTRGNVNGQGITDLSDLSLLISYLTSVWIVLPCYDAANVNGAGVVDLSDLSSLISYLIAHSTPLPACP